MSDWWDSLSSAFTPITAPRDPEKDYLGSTPGGGLGNALYGNRNALVGLGLGLMGGSPENRFGDALKGFSLGANNDALAGYRQALLRQHAADQAFRRQEAQRAQQNADRTFQENQRQFNVGRTPPPTIDKIENERGETEFYFKDPSKQIIKKLTPGQVQSMGPAIDSGQVSFNDTTATPSGNNGVTPTTSATTDTGAPVPPEAAIPGTAMPVQGTQSGSPVLPPGVNRKKLIEGFSSEAGREQAKLQQKQEEERIRQEKSPASDIVSKSVDAAIKLIDDPSNNLPVAGAVGGRLGNYGVYQPAIDLREHIAPIKANATFETLQKLRSQSQSGGSGLGNLSNQEGEKLAATLGSLDQSQSPAQLKQNLRRVEAIFYNAKYGENAYETKAMNEARDLIKGGKDPNKVKQRLLESGINPAGL